MRKLNIIGEKYNRLTVIQLDEERCAKLDRKYLICKCDCGKITSVQQHKLRSGHTKSCGCLKDQSRRNPEKCRKLYQVNIKRHPRETTAMNLWRNRYDDGVSFEDFLKLTQYNCYYCNHPPNINSFNQSLRDVKSSSFAKENGEFTYNGLDRVDNSKDHSVSNILTCCKWCNYSKRNLNIIDFINYMIKFHNFQHKIGN